MSKNLTRKGLAFGALVALGSSVIAGAPASAVGIANDYVALTDTKETGNYNMLSTGFIELDGYFSGAAQLGAGAELKYYVEDPNAISVFDIDPNSATDTVVSATNLTRIGALNSATGDIVSVTIATDGTAHDIEAGDAITITALGATSTSAGFTVADLNKVQRVTRATSLDLTTAATGAIATAAFGTGLGGLDKITLTVNDASGLAAGDLITVALGAGSATGGTGTLADTEMEGTFVVESVSGNSVVYSANTGLTAGTGTWTSSGAGTVKSDSVSFVPGTEVTTSTIAATTLSSQGSIAENTSSTAIDTLANLRAAAFGAAGVVGVATARSTDAATINNYVIDSNEEDAVAGDQVVRLGTVSATTNGSIKVTAWIDNDNDGVIDSTEYVSPTRTINFVLPADALYTIGQTNVYIGSSSVTGTVSADLNLGEIGAQSLLELSTDHIDVSQSVGSQNVAETDQSFTYNSTTKLLNATEALTSALGADDSVRFAIESANVEVGSASTFGVGALSVAGSTLVVAASKDNTEVNFIDTNGTAMSSQAVKVRKGAASVVATYTAYNDDPTDVADNKVVGNVPFTASVTSSAVDAADGVKVNDKVVDGGTETITGLTDANGQIKFTLTQTAADASDVVTVSVDVQGVSVSGLVAFTYESANYYVYNAAGAVDASNDYNKSLVIGGTLAQTYIVADQFGVAPANGTVVVTATRSGSRSDTAATWGYQVPVVDGVANVSIIDNGKGTGSDTVTIKSVPLLAGGSLDTHDDSNSYTLVYVASAADYTPTAVTAVLSHDGVDDTATDDKPVAIETKTLINHDSRAVNGVNAPVYATNNVDTSAVADTADAQLTLSGVVNNAANGLIAGTTVTIKATGLVFKFTTADGATIYGKDTITINTTATGAYSVAVYGDRGGKQTITVTAGAATKTADVTFAVGTPAALALTAPATAQAGRAVDVVATVTDKYGVGSKGTTVSFTTEGAGYLNSASGVTDAAGKVTLKLILGPSETGSTVITAKATIADVEVSKTATVVTAAAPVAPAVVAGVSGGTGKFNVAVTNAAGKSVVVKVAGKFFKSFAGTADKKTVAIKATKGSKKVTVYVGGKLVATKTVTVK